MRWKGIPRASVANAVRDSLWCLHRNQYHDVTCVIDPIGAASIDAPRRAATDGKTAQGNPSAVPESEPIFSSGPSGTRTRDLHNAIVARSQLRYGPFLPPKVELRGLEPLASTVRL